MMRFLFFNSHVGVLYSCYAYGVDGEQFICVFHVISWNSEWYHKEKNGLKKGRKTQTVECLRKRIVAGKCIEDGLYVISRHISIDHAELTVSCTTKSLNANTDTGPEMNCLGKMVCGVQSKLCSNMLQLQNNIDRIHRFANECWRNWIKI